MKKKVKKKKAKNGNSTTVTDGLGIALPEEKIQYLESQIQALQIQLSHRSEGTSNAFSKCDSMRKTLIEATQKYDEEKQLSLDLTQNMTRQYKGMQDNLLNKINSCERVIEDLRVAAEVQSKEYEQKVNGKEGIIQERNQAIRLLEKKTESLCFDFAKMLSDAVNQMKERIEVHSLYNNQAVPIQHRMEEFNLQGVKSLK